MADSTDRISFARDEQGAVAMIFALMTVVIFGMAGLAIDGGRAYHTVARVNAALDSAALAAAKAMNEQGLEGAELKAYAERYFDANVLKAGLDLTSYQNFSVTTDSTSGSVRTSVDTRQVNFFGGILNMPEYNFTREATAVYNIKDLELGMMLDVTGSMSGGKIADLKDAAKDLVEILIEGSNSAREVRIGLAPYSAAVNAGGYAAAVTDPAAPSTDGCVLERAGGHAYRDTIPGPGKWLGAAELASPPSDIDPTEGFGGYFCPGARVVPITDDTSLLKSRIDALTTSGWTAGHLGLAWAWYLVSPDWAGVWPGSSTPVAYDEEENVKAVLMMTDGILNTAYDNDTSSEQARALCDNIRDNGVIVFSVAFEAPWAAQDLLEDCASPETSELTKTYFDADNGTELREAFRSIAAQLNNLRLAK